MTDELPANVIPLSRAARRVHRQRIKVQRANKFRIEMPLVLHELLGNYDQMCEVIVHYVRDFAESKGAPPEVIDSLRVVFVGGLEAARARDQAWFTDYLSPGMILICWEADV